MPSPRFLTHSHSPNPIGDTPESRALFDQQFEAGQHAGICRGVFSSQSEAAAAAPASLPLGYDHDGPASMYRDRLKRVFPGDYPMIYWLGRALGGGATRIFDLGGHVGVSYYAYQRYLRFPEALTWQVNDVPAVNTLGAELSSMLDKRAGISFTEHFAGAEQADVLFTSGCLQYLEQTLAEKLDGLPSKPRWLLVNLLPLHKSRAYWTVQNIETAFCPYRIQQEAVFFEGLTALGYKLLDRWENPEKQCEVAFDPEHSLEQYYGAAFKLT
ncbi:MAG: methyltransferase, TIGR04325 family [Burkholderiaceae bacterium]